MKFSTSIISGAVLAGMMLGTGCVATRKFVRNKVSPVETRVGDTEKKNGEQDTAIAANKSSIDEVDRDLSRTKERVTDIDTKTQAAAAAAQKADQKADQAGQAAADARSFAEKSTGELRKTIDGMTTYRMVKEDSVQFALNKSTLSDEAKATLDELAKSLNGMNNYVIEVQGFTDKTGTPSYNFRLSQARAESVARYFAVTYKVPLRYIHMLGEGSLVEVADNHTRAGRQQNRRVDVKVWAPESETSKSLAASR
jgi:outer membrane protein OmpA-like peptidoglycan-associated protein